MESDVTEERIRNWAIWARFYDMLGSELSVAWSAEESAYYPSDRAQAYGVADTGFTPDEQDAGEVERVMLRLKHGSYRERSAYWALWERFVMNRDPITAADAHRWTVTRYRELVEQGIAMVRRALK